MAPCRPLLLVAAGFIVVVCTCPGCDDERSTPDASAEDAGRDATTPPGTDGGRDAGVDAGTDGGADAGYPEDPDSLRAVADIPVGAAVDMNALAGEPIYAETLARELDSVTPENVMKWGPVQPARDRWDFEAADELVDFAEAHGMRVRGHALVWHNQLPGWIDEAMTPEDLRSALEEHIATLVGRYRGRIDAWDVVNEAIGDRSGGFRDTIFLRKLGEEYVADAFELADAADPDALLFYNDYGAEGSGVKSDWVYSLVRGLVEDGAPIDGVGLQMHVDGAAYPDPGAVTGNIERLGDLGLIVEITEMDVQIRNVADSPLEVQRGVYHDLVAACASQAACGGVTFWGFTDAHSWVDWFFGPDDPLLFDESYERKPAYWGVRDALEGR